MDHILNSLTRWLSQRRIGAESVAQGNWLCFLHSRWSWHLSQRLLVRRRRTRAQYTSGRSAGWPAIWYYQSHKLYKIQRRWLLKEAISQHKNMETNSARFAGVTNSRCWLVDRVAGDAGTLDGGIAATMDDDCGFAATMDDDGLVAWTIC
jgi:hypothetical protein